MKRVKMMNFEAEVRKAFQETFRCPNCGANKVKEMITQDSVIVGCNECRLTLNKYCVYKKMSFDKYIEMTANEMRKAHNEGAI
jgi:ribosomal protein L37AE/L43A